MFHCIDRLVCRIEDAAMSVVAVSLFLVMIVKFVDVLLRYAFNAPLEWSYGFISHYLLISAFFLALPFTFRTGRHVRVDAFVNRLSSSMRRILRLVDLLVSLVLFGLIFYQAIALVTGAWNAAEVMPDFYNWPSWTSKIFVPIGIGLLEVRLLLNVVTAIVQGVPGPELVAFGSGPSSDKRGAKAMAASSGVKST